MRRVLKVLGDSGDLVAATAVATETVTYAPGSIAGEVIAAAPPRSLRETVSEIICAEIAAGDAPATITSSHFLAVAVIFAAAGSVDSEAHF